MDFDSFENLSSEEINELYNDVVQKDYLACDCLAQGYVSIPDSEEIHRGSASIPGYRGLCDEHMNSSNYACYVFCHEVLSDSKIESFVGRYLGCYIPGFSFGTMHFLSWDGVLSGNASYGYCTVPEGVECDWARISRHGNHSRDMRDIAGTLFIRFCK